MIDAVVRAGGIRDDEGHDIRRTMDIRRPGFFSRTGRGIDELGETLWEQGYFGPVATTPRPTVADVLDLIDRATREKTYRAEDAAALDVERARRESRNLLERRAGELGVPFSARTSDEDLAAAIMDRAVEVARDGGAVPEEIAEAVAERLDALELELERLALQDEPTLDQERPSDAADIPFTAAEAAATPAFDLDRAGAADEDAQRSGGADGQRDEGQPAPKRAARRRRRAEGVAAQGEVQERPGAAAEGGQPDAAVQGVDPAGEDRAGAPAEAVDAAAFEKMLDDAIAEQQPKAAPARNEFPEGNPQLDPAWLRSRVDAMPRDQQANILRLLSIGSIDDAFAHRSPREIFNAIQRPVETEAPKRPEFDTSGRVLGRMPPLLPNIAWLRKKVDGLSRDDQRTLLQRLSIESVDAAFQRRTIAEIVSAMDPQRYPEPAPQSRTASEPAEPFKAPEPPKESSGVPRKPRAKAKLTKTEERGAAEIAKSFGLHTSKAGTEAVTALYKLFGGGKPGRLTSGIGFDDETYAAAKPHFDAMWREIKAAGGDLAEFARKLVGQFGAEIKPYAMRWFQEQNPKTAGTRVGWKTLAEWVTAAHEIGSRGPSSQAYKQQAAHAAALPAALIQAETDVELLRQIKRAFADGQSYLRERPGFGTMGLHIDKADGTRILQAVNDRLYVLEERPADQKPGARHKTAALREKLITFASGMSRIGDINAGSAAVGGDRNRGIGVDVGELSNPAIGQLARAAVDRKANIFIDSGAFSLFKRQIKAADIEREPTLDGIAPQAIPDTTPIDFDAVLARYDTIVQQFDAANPSEDQDATKPFLVMPDIVGDQLGSIELARIYQRWMSVEMGANSTRPIVPIQRGPLSLTEAYRQLVEILGTDRFIVGIPSNEKAVPIDELRKFLEEAKPRRIHFLGSAAGSRLTPKLEAIVDAGIDVEHLSADANILRSALYGKMPAGASRADAIVETLMDPTKLEPPSIPGAPSPTAGKGSIENQADKVDEAAPTPALPDPVAAPKPEEVKPPAQAELTDEKLLGALGISVERATSKNGKPVIEVKGKTFDYRELLKRAGAKWYGPKKVWSFWSDEGLASFVKALRGDPGALAAAAAADAGGAGNAGSAPRGSAADEARAAELARRAAREREDNRPDESRLGPDDAALVSDRTRELIQTGGERASMPKEAIDGQLEDIALINKAYRSKKPAFVLANEPGTGKTFVLAGAIEEMRTSGAKGFVYVTMSRGLIDQVRDDFTKAGFRADDVEFTTYSALSSGENVPVFAGKVAIFDEGHNVKNVQSARGKQGAQLLAEASFSIFSSATPFENPVQAEYLAPTGLFNEAGGFVDWAVIYGAAVKERKIRNERGQQELLRIPYWPGGQAKVPDAQAARRWFVRQGIFTSRRKILNPDLVTSSFRRIEATREGLEMYRHVEAAYQRALNTYTDENGRPRDGSGQIYYQIGAHRMNAMKRVIESMKVEAAIKLAQQHLADGKRVVFFVETKADRTLGRFAVSEGYAKHHGIKRTTLHAYPKMQQMMAEHDRARELMRRSGGRASDAGPAPFADFIIDIAREFHEAGVLYELPSTASKLAEAFPKDQVAFYTGAFTDAQNAQAKADFQGGKKRVFIATMAKGGTGLSLHDTTGDKPTVQININLPWSSTQFDQVANRTARYGLRSKAEVDWLFIGGKTLPIERNFEQDQSPEALAMESEGGPVAPSVRYVEDVPLEPRIARRVADRMRSLGATVKGIEARSHKQLEDWTFEDDHDATDAMLTDASAETAAAQEQAAESDVRGGDDPYQLAERLQQLEKGKNRNSEFGYFPTPLPVSMLMSRLAAVADGDTVLEPSAGTGNLLKFLPGGAQITAVELRQDNHADLQRMLSARTTPATAIHDNFIRWADEQTTLPQFDAIVMNPPFENRQDAKHVMRAFHMLKPGGRLVAIVSEGPFFASDAASKMFRELLEEHGGISVKMPAKAFKDYGTSVNTRLVVLDRNGRTGYTEHAADSYDRLSDIEGLIPSRGARYAMPPGTIPGFFSRVRATIEKQDRAEAPGGFWKQQLQAAVNKGQVSLHELNWTGMMQWLGEQEGKVSKTSILQWLDQHGITVTEQEPQIAGGLDGDDGSGDRPEYGWSDVSEIEPSAEFVRDEAENFKDEARELLAQEADVDPEDVSTRAVQRRAEEMAREFLARSPEYQSENEAIAKDGSAYVLRVAGSDEIGWWWEGKNETHDASAQADGNEYRDAEEAQAAALQWARDDAEMRTQPGLAYSSDKNAGGVRGYSLPGGRAHRELLLTLPPHLTDGEKFTLDHWTEYSDGNVIAHMRGAEHTFADGTKGWLWDEMQSDWNRKLRAQGSVAEAIAREDAAEKRRDEAFDAFMAEAKSHPTVKALLDERIQARRDGKMRTPVARTTIEQYVALTMTGEELADGVAGAALDRLIETASLLRLKQDELRQEMGRAPGLPDMPFRDARWTELTVKRALLWAAQNGYSRMAWVTGKQTQERYDLTRVVDTVDWEADPYLPGGRKVHLNGKTARSDIRLTVTPDGKIANSTEMRFRDASLAEIVGGDLAKRIMSEESGVLGKADLRIGGAWATNLYDKQIPQLVEKILKPYGVKTGRAELAHDGVTARLGGFEAILPGQTTGYTFPTREEAAAWVAQHPKVAVHAIDIPQPAIDALKADGLPLLATASAAASPAESALTREVLMQVLADAAKIIPTANVKVAREMTRDGVGRIRGIYEPVKQIVALAVNPHLETANPRAAARMTIRHEAVHFLRANNFITPREWQVLADAARRLGWINDPYAQTYRNEPDVMIEEAVAVAFENWSARTNTYEGAVARVFAKLRAFLDRLRNSLRGRGFQNADDVFNAIERGDVGRRQQGMRERESWINRMAAAWHGTPHEFDRFDISKIGTGEGAQVYGYGLYFASSRGVAEHYKRVLTEKKIAETDWWSNVSLPPTPTRAEDDRFNAITQQMRKDGNVPAADLAEWERIRAIRVAYDDAVRAAKPKGRLLKVELAPAEDEYLHWDDALIDQPEKVKEALRKIGIDPDSADEADRSGGTFYSMLTNRALGEYPGATKGYPPPPGFNAQRAASDQLRAAGIRGVKYFDGNSRGQWQVTYPEGGAEFFGSKRLADAHAKRNGGTVSRGVERTDFNYVIFDDADVTIQERYAPADDIFAGKTTEKLKNMAGKARDQLVIPGAAHVAVAGPLRAKKAQAAAEALPLFGGAAEKPLVEKAAEVAKKDQGELFALFDRSFRDRVAAMAEEARGGARPPGNVAVEEPKQSRDLSQLKVPFFIPTALFKDYPLLRRFVQRASQRLNMMERSIQRMRLEYDQLMTGLDDGQRADVMTLMLDAEARAKEDESFSGVFTADELRENGVAAPVAEAYRKAHRLLDKGGRLVDQHERAMKPFLRNVIKPQVLQALRAAAGAKGISSADFDRLMAQRSIARAQARAGVDTTARMTAIDAELGVDPTPETEDRLTQLLATLDSIDSRLARGSIRRIKGYVPHKFFGSWALYKIVPDGETNRLELVPYPETGFAETRAQALRHAADVAGADPEGQYVVRPVRANFATAQMLQLTQPQYEQLMDGIASTFGTSPDETRDALEAGNVRARSMRRWASFKQRREWVAGHSQDINRVFDAHLAEVNRYVALDTLKYEALRIEDRMGLTPQNKSRATLTTAFQAYVRDIMGEKQPLETRIDELFERPWAQPIHVAMASGLATFVATGGLSGNPFIGVLAGSFVGWRMYKARSESGGFTSRAMTGELTSITAHMKLGAFFNVFTPLVNLMQFFVNGLPIVGYEYGLQGSMRAIKAGIAAATGKDSADLRVLRRHNIAPVSNLSEVDPGLMRREGVAAKASMFLFNTAERFNRASIFLGAMQKALDAAPAQAAELVADWSRRAGGNQAVNLDPEGRFTWAGAQRYANFATTRANFDMTAANRPQALRNVFLRVPLQFKNYVVQQIAFVAGLRGKEIAVFAAHLFLVAGMLGLPGADQLDWLVEWLSGWSPKTELLKWAVANAAGKGAWGDLAYFLVRGVPAALGVDISSRAGMGENFIPKLQLTDLIGPLAGTAVRAHQLAGKEATFADQLRNWTPGLGAPAKMLEAAANGMPLSMAMTNPTAFVGALGDGRAVLTSPWKHGAPELDPQKLTTPQLGLMAVGGTPRDLTMLRDQLAIRRDLVDRERSARQSAYDRIGQAYTAYYETDRARFIAVIREEQRRLREKGIDLSNQSVREFIAKQRLPREARDLKTAPVAVRRELEGLTR